jgi:hypothetical protein
MIAREEKSEFDCRKSFGKRINYDKVLEEFEEKA